MRFEWRPAPLLILTLLTGCGGGHPPLATIEPVPGSRTHEGREIVPLDSIRSHEIKPLGTGGREIVPLDSGRMIRPLTGEPPSGREIRRLGDTTAATGREITPLDGEIVPVNGTTWRGANYEGELTLEFLVGGVLRYSTSNGTWSNGTWHQEGHTISFEMNSHFADYSGRIRGTRMSGTGHNRAGRTWDWQATRQ